MNTDIPTVDEIRDALKPFTHAPMQRLAKLSGVPFTTLWKIKDGTTKNPGVATVRQFLPHVSAAKLPVLPSIPQAETTS